MYVCLCKPVTDRQVRHAVERGACRMRELRQELGICNQCGKCARDVRDLLEAHRPSALTISQN